MVPLATGLTHGMVDLGRFGRLGVLVPADACGITPLPAQVWPDGLLKRIRRA